MTNEGNENPMYFTPVISFIQPGFWGKLSELKINVDQLDETERTIWGYYTNVASQAIAQIVNLESSSFNSEPAQNVIPFHGKIINKNTIEQFRECDKNDLIVKKGAEFLRKLQLGEILQRPSYLNWFFALSFADLKKYCFYYWFAYPVPQNLPFILNKNYSIREKFDDQELLDLHAKWDCLDIHQKPYFLVEKTELGLQIHPLKSKLSQMNGVDYKNYYFGFADLITDEVAPPRSQLKNYLLMISYCCKFLDNAEMNILQFSAEFNRDLMRWDCSRSRLFSITVPKIDFEKIVWAGWEKNERGKMGPRMSDMRSTMDPKRLFKESMDLNLKLMKWRLLPNIDLEKIQNSRCLLLGSGTLGCSVARTLLGWGVQTITFVDSSHISYSNPARQILFSYEDAIKRLPKAEAAAESLKRIFPDIDSKGYQFTIPMPGHSVSDATIKETQENVEKLEQLIIEHDQIFTLTDSRESRWLPTLLACYHKKTVINVALGFDSYLVMRFGGESSGEKFEAPPSGFGVIEGSELGCYFCNDVTAPGDSLTGRTLDQQCTVTRPGVSLIAGALAVELAVSLTQHPNGINAPAFYKMGIKSCLDEELDCNDYGSILGLLPHSIRGFLSSFSQVLPATQKYNKCIACSEIVLRAYKEEGFKFLFNAFNSSKYLEDLTGLTDLQSDFNYVNIMELSDNDDDDD